MSLSVSDLFRWYANNMPKTISKNSPFVKELENNYLEKIDQVKWIVNEEDEEVEKEINNMIDKGFLQTDVDWERLYPQGQNFGFTDTHLNERENVHFSAIESLFESDFKKIPQLWNIFQQRRVVGNPSAFGIVLEVGTPSFPAMFIVKSPQTMSKELLHEYLIGKEVCNQLRKYRIPNFPYFFGLIKCSKVRVDTKGKVISWCEKRNPESIPQIIMENIRTNDQKGQILPPQTLSDYIKKSDGNDLDWVVIFLLGVMNAIFTAWKEFGFSHNDLHTSNVMLRKVPPGSVKSWMIPVIFDLGYLIVKPSQSIPTIIDFGKSNFINLEAKKTQISYPKILNEAESDSFSKSRPMNDILHLMSFIQNNISDRRKTLSSHTFGRKVDIILEQIYLVFYQLLGEYSETKSGLFESFKQIPTLEEFRVVFSTTANWFNLPSEFIFIENETFIQKFITNVLQLEFIQPYLEGHYLKPQTESSFQSIYPNVVVDLIKKSTNIPTTSTSSSSTTLSTLTTSTTSSQKKRKIP